MSAAKTPVIDVHCHLTPQCFQRAVLAGDLWHGMSPADGELSNLKNRWLPDRRIEEMDALGIDMQLVSSTDVFFQYEREASVTAAIARDCNDELAELVRAHPDRFMGIGTLPMQDTKLAVAELERAMGELGLKGMMVNDHVNGLTYDHESFRDLWAAADELGAFVLFHQFHPTTVAYRTMSYFLFNSVGNLVDRTLTFGALVYGGVVDDFPNIKFCFAHAGGYIPYALDRMDKGWEKFEDSRGRTLGPPSSYANRFYYDTVVFKDTHLRFLVDMVGADRMVFGTDWPAPMDVDDPVRRIENTPVLADAERAAILGGTTATIFG
ncbi:MAG TPA: amidohydrolase family protein [Gaiellaceae bacterium]|jgi:aminocarboxymuconate-semialdehyde decarboxylase|nr:amidohydrolase family protein [Gaiellaceae bacterium]